MIKAKPWKGKDLKGEWEVTIKIDGVRMLRDSEGNPVSRAGKPLYNLDHLPGHLTDAEVFEKDWESSITLVRTQEGEPVKESSVYSLDPLDDRLFLTTFHDPSAEDILEWMQDIVDKGHEGIVLRQGNKWLKVKPKETYDVEVTGIVEGTGKHKGRMGALITPMGKVGTGFDDAARQLWWYRWPVPLGTIIEVECMSLTKDGKFRHPRYVRQRFDKC